MRPNLTSKPIRRLVAKGRDTPENLALFFGGQGQPSTEDFFSKAYKDIRLEILLRPPPGSPSYVYAEGLGLDDGYPPSTWTPREPSPAEAREIREVRDMQETVRRHMGARGVSDVSNADMRDIVAQNFGDRWVDGMQVCTCALNTMDRGVGGGR